MVCKKKLHLLKSVKKEEKVEIYHSKREKDECVVTSRSIESNVRELLFRKVSGTFLGLWLLIPEHLKVGTWDILKEWTGSKDAELEPRLALQMVHESCLCVNGIRPVRSLCNQGFELVNGLPFIATDTSIHRLLDKHTVLQAQNMQISLGLKREKSGDYSSGLLAIDPHRIKTYSKRIMPMKKKSPDEKAQKVLQTFFCIDVVTGQPLGCTIGLSGKKVTRASIELLEMIKKIHPNLSLVTADTEHATSVLVDYLSESECFNMLIPVSSNTKIKKVCSYSNFRRMYPGFAIAETDFKFSNSLNTVKLIIERLGENESEYEYKGFITSSKIPATDLLSEKYPQRWSIEEFFNFESGLGWNKVNTTNLNIKYGKISLSLIAQSVLYQFRKKLPAPYKNWTANHLADSIFSGIDGDIKVSGNTIFITIYNLPESLNIRQYYENLPDILQNQNIDPRIPWLFNFKLNFKFK